jgi:hypothetical protein
VEDGSDTDEDELEKTRKEQKQKQKKEVAKRGESPEGGEEEQQELTLINTAKPGEPLKWADWHLNMNSKLHLLNKDFDIKYEWGCRRPLEDGLAIAKNKGISTRVTALITHGLDYTLQSVFEICFGLHHSMFEDPKANRDGSLGTAICVFSESLADLLSDESQCFFLSTPDAYAKEEDTKTRKTSFNCELRVSQLLKTSTPSRKDACPYAFKLVCSQTFGQMRIFMRAKSAGGKRSRKKATKPLTEDDFSADLVPAAARNKIIKIVGYERDGTLYNNTSGHVVHVVDGETAQAKPELYKRILATCHGVIHLNGYKDLKAVDAFNETILVPAYSLLAPHLSKKSIDLPLIKAEYHENPNTVPRTPEELIKEGNRLWRKGCEEATLEVPAGVEDLYTTVQSMYVKPLSRTFPLLRGAFAKLVIPSVLESNGAQEDETLAAIHKELAAIRKVHMNMYIPGTASLSITEAMVSRVKTHEVEAVSKRRTKESKKEAEAEAEEKETKEADEEAEADTEAETKESTVEAEEKKREKEKAPAKGKAIPVKKEQEEWKTKKSTKEPVQGKRKLKKISDTETAAEEQGRGKKAKVETPVAKKVAKAALPAKKTTPKVVVEEDASEQATEGEAEAEGEEAATEQSAEEDGQEE